MAIAVDVAVTMTAGPVNELGLFSHQIAVPAIAPITITIAIAIAIAVTIVVTAALAAAVGVGVGARVTVGTRGACL